MITPIQDAKNMLIEVANALGQDMLQKVAFVGGCTTSLLLTDDLSLEYVRLTEDVDLIVGIVGRIQWHKFEELLRSKGFSPSTEDGVLCRMRLDDLKVDFMPCDENILGFTNRWYELALETATEYDLNDEVTIRVLTPPLFVATKLEAYLGRGNNDPISSKDIEDIISLFDGRQNLVTEIQDADHEIKDYIAEQLRKLLSNSNFEYAVKGSTRSSKDREELIFQKIDELTGD